MELLKSFCNIPGKCWSFLYECADKWYETQIETLTNGAGLIKNKYMKSSHTHDLPTLMKENKTIYELGEKMNKDMNAHKDRFIVIYNMFREMEIEDVSAKQLLQLLIDIETPDLFLDELCKVWRTYKTFSNMSQLDLFDADTNIIETNKGIAFKHFRFLVSNLLGINEGNEHYLRDYYKFQADINKTMELRMLTKHDTNNITLWTPKTTDNNSLSEIDEAESHVLLEKGLIHNTTQNYLKKPKPSVLHNC